MTDRTGRLFFNKSNAGYIVLEPASSEANPFLWLTEKALVSKGFKFIPPSSQSRRTVPQYIILNWYDEIRGSWLTAPLRYFKKRLRASWFFLNATKVIFVVHNRKPHDGLSHSAAFFSRRMRHVLCQKADAIVGLCKATEDVLIGSSSPHEQDMIKRKFHVVPHPNYSAYYGNLSEEQALSTASSTNEGTCFTFLFVGMIRPYKNIELILHTARKFNESALNARFVIAGKTISAEYFQRLCKEAPDNVEMREGFIPDQQICNLIDSSDALILPYNIESSLNSGTCMLAFTLGKTVVCPRIGTLEDIPDSLVYSYSYSNEFEHAQKLTSKAFEAYHDKADSPTSFAEKGRRLREIVENRNSLSAVSNAWDQVLDSLDN